MVAIAGAPASGKSTLSDRLHHHLGGDEAGVVVVPMDGFHLDNAILRDRDLLPRKGAPQTFDFRGFHHMLSHIHADDGPVCIPVFDRTLDLSRGSARIVSPAHRIILVEGNYLLLQQKPWPDLAPLFDLTVFLDAPLETLEARLIQRWIDHGHDATSARTRALSNDIPNARLVQGYSRPADIIINGNG
ncbi:MAG: nucleoside triphosphate hydrolase [Pseudomonadota bacterium]